MTSWTLILWIHAGMLSDHDSMALLRVPHFLTQGDCQGAGRAAAGMTNGTMKAAKFVCVEVREKS